MNVIHNEEKSRFEVFEDDHLARLEYRMREGKMYFMHTKVPDALSGKGIASALAKTALNHAQSEEIEIVVYCPFVKAYMQRHPEYDHLLAQKEKE